MTLTNTILSHINQKIIEEYNNDWTGFTQVHPFTLLTYIHSEYGQVSDDELTTNESKLSEPWDPATPIKTLYEHIDECRSFAEARNDPITERTTLRKAYMALKHRHVRLQLWHMGWQK